MTHGATSRNAEPSADLAGNGLSHPLMGANLRTLLRAYGSARSLAPRRWPFVAASLASALARLPASLLEAAWSAVQPGPAPGTQPPVFIVGHWRSGTTHLHNVMGCDPQFGHISPLAAGLPWNLWTLAAWLRPLLERALPADRHVDRVAVTPRSPQEDEIPLASMQPLSVFHAVYFPRRFRQLFARGVFFDGAAPREIARWQRLHRQFLNKVSRQQGRPRLLVKNPVYTGRLAMLRAIWPGAKFIHIYRNPYVVYQSTLHYYRSLLPTLALQPYDHLRWESFVLDTYVRLMARYEAQAEEFSPNQLAEVRFESFEEDPLGVLSLVYDQLELPGFEQARPAFAAYLDEVATYRKNRYRSLDDDSVERVRAALGYYIERWSYEPLAAAE